MAITVGAIVLVIARATLEEASDVIARARAERRALDRRSNGRRFLSHAFASLETGTAAAAFHGWANEVELSTWLPSASGRFERRAVALRLRADTLVATARSSFDALRGSTDYILETGVAALSLDYLLDFGAAAPWQREWRSEVTLPLAVRLRLRYVEPRPIDTLLFVVGTRG